MLLYKYCLSYEVKLGENKYEFHKELYQKTKIIHFKSDLFFLNYYFKYIVLGKIISG